MMAPQCLTGSLEPFAFTDRRPLPPVSDAELLSSPGYALVVKQNLDHLHSIVLSAEGPRLERAREQLAQTQGEWDRISQEVRDQAMVALMEG